MKIQIEQRELLGLLAKIQNIVEKRNTMPILINVLLEAADKRLKIFATDLEVSLTDSIEAKVDVAGKVAVNAKNLFDIVKEMPEGPVKLHKKDNNWLEISQNKAVFNIVGISPDEYPVFPTFSTNEFTKIKAEVLADMIEKTIYSVANDETRYHLNGVYFERIPNKGTTGFRMVATDGHRLSLVDRKSEGNANGKGQQTGVIIPRKGLHEIRKLLENVEGDFEMSIEGSQLVVRHGPTVLMIRLIEGKYPDYNRLIPQNLTRQLVVEKESFLSSLKRVSLLSNQKSKGVTLSISSGKMEISSNNPELGDAHEEIDVDYKGKDIKIGFNAKYILDVLNTIEDEKIEISLQDQLSPGLVRPHSDSNYTCVVMPMRI